MLKKPKYLLKKEKTKKSKKDLICIPIVNKKKETIDFQYSTIIKKDKKINEKRSKIISPSKKSNIRWKYALLKKTRIIFTKSVANIFY